ncbi:MAG: hypothetical protein AAF399_20720 [Bacteroidota bacterium]
MVLDAGQQWQRWEGTFPTVPVSDLVVHPREGDLVVATFGRSFWILDDLQPLRFRSQFLSGQGRMQPLHLFAPPVAYVGVIGESIGYRKGKVGEALFEGENRPYGALISYQLAESLLGDTTLPNNLPLEEQVHIQIKDGAGNLLRNLYQTPKAGLNRLVWNLRMDGLRPLSMPEPKSLQAPPDGFLVVPGKYEVILSYQGRRVKQSLEVKADPRINWSSEAYAEKAAFLAEFQEVGEEMLAAADQLRKVEAGMNRVKSRLEEAPDSVLSHSLDTLSGALDEMKEQMFGKKVQGIYRNPATLQSQWYQTMMLADDAHSPPSPNQQIQLKQLRTSWEQWQTTWENWVEKDLSAFQEEMQERALGWW